jgi:hypothetical protein
MMNKNRLGMWVVVGLGVVYFLSMIPPNLRGAMDPTHFISGDEAVTYPYVVNMLQPSKDIHELAWRMIIYGDYHYGYPFYLASFLSLLPLRLFSGATFFANTQLNLLVLRQVISVLPMVLAVAVLVYLQTRFRRAWVAAGLTLFLLSIPGVVRQNIQWWHPDAMTLLAVVLTIFFLERDRQRLGRNFWLAAFTCGLATAIKLLGIFFVLTIPGYLLVGLFQKKITFKRTTLAGLGFIVLMSVTIVISNPFLMYQSQREKLVRVQADKQLEIAVGYTHDDPAGYQKGPQFWEWTLNQMYGSTPLLILLAGGLVCGCVWGQRKGLHRLILSWSIPLTLYLFYFVAPKPDHYWLPVMLPLFSSVVTPLELLYKGWKTASKPWGKWAAAAGLILATIALVYWFGANLSYDIPHWIQGVNAN